MDVFVYFVEPLPCGLDEIEDALDQALGNNGEVTGSGVGIRGSNIDITIRDDAATTTSVLDLIRRALRRLRLPQNSQVVINNERFPLLLE